MSGAVCDPNPPRPFLGLEKIPWKTAHEGKAIKMCLRRDFSISGREKQSKHKAFGWDIPRTSGRISGWTSRQNNFHPIARSAGKYIFFAWTSLTRRRGRPRPDSEEVSEKVYAGKLRADFSLSNYYNSCGEKASNKIDHLFKIIGTPPTFDPSQPQKKTLEKQRKMAENTRNTK